MSNKLNNILLKIFAIKKRLCLVIIPDYFHSLKYLQITVHVVEQHCYLLIFFLF